MVNGWKQRTIALVMLNTASAIGLLAVAPEANAEVKSVENLSHATSIAIAPTQYSAPPDAALSEDGYLLGPGDRVKVDFFNVPEYSGEYSVLPNGSIQFPIAGAITVRGLSLTEAGKKVTAVFKPHFKQSPATVTLVTARPVGISISGEVNRPGTYTLSAQPTSGEMLLPNLTRAIQMADGMTQIANIKEITVRRRRSGGGTDTMQVNLWQLLNTGDNAQDIRLQDGDSIFIPAASGTNVQDARRLANTSFSTKTNRTLRIVVVGEVNRPGPHSIGDTGALTVNELRGNPVSRVPTVTQALQVAGGITQLADVRGIEVRRLTSTGQQQTVPVSFWDLLTKGDIQQDLPLQDGDTIYIPTATNLNDRETTQLALASFSPDKVSINVVGQVERPGNLQLPPNTPMNQAILAAGGFSRKAQTGNVTLVRLNQNGTVTKREIGVDFGTGVNDQNNPALRPNDTIVVRQSGFSRVTDEVGAFASPFSTFFNIFKLFGLF
jgi:polysaccharide biosynthesis/export protein